MRRIVEAGGGILIVAFLLLNLFGGVVSFVWLVAIGLWKVAVAGFVVGLIAPTLLGVALIPNGIFGLGAESARPFSILLRLIAARAWIYLVIAGWHYFAFGMFINNPSDERLLPLLLASYSTAVGPWGYMAQRDAQAGLHESGITVMFTQTCYLMFALTVLFGSSSPNEYLWVLFSTLFVAFVIETALYAYPIYRQARAGFSR